LDQANHPPTSLQKEEQPKNQSNNATKQQSNKETKVNDSDPTSEI